MLCHTEWTWSQCCTGGDLHVTTVTPCNRCTASHSYVHYLSILLMWCMARAGVRAMHQCRCWSRHCLVAIVIAGLLIHCHCCCVKGSMWWGWCVNIDVISSLFSLPGHQFIVVVVASKYSVMWVRMRAMCQHQCYCCAEGGHVVRVRRALLLMMLLLLSCCCHHGESESEVLLLLHCWHQHGRWMGRGWGWCIVVVLMLSTSTWEKEGMRVRVTHCHHWTTTMSL